MNEIGIKEIVIAIISYLAGVSTMIVVNYSSKKKIHKVTQTGNKVKGDMSGGNMDKSIKLK